MRFNLCHRIFVITHTTSLIPAPVPLKSNNLASERFNPSLLHARQMNDNLTVHNLFHRHHASALWEQCQSHHGHGHGNLVIAGKCRGGDAAAAMGLEVEAGAAITFAGRAAASAWEAGSSGLRVY